MLMCFLYQLTRGLAHDQGHLPWLLAAGPACHTPLFAIRWLEPHSQGERPRGPLFCPLTVPPLPPLPSVCRATGWGWGRLCLALPTSPTTHPQVPIHYWVIRDCRLQGGTKKSAVLLAYQPRPLLPHTQVPYSPSGAGILLARKETEKWSVHLTVTGWGDWSFCHYSRWTFII